MKRIDSYVGSTSKLKGKGDIAYCLWVDDKGGLYTQFTENEDSGTFSSDVVFSVSKYLPIRNSDKAINPLSGYDIKTNKFVSVTDNNNGAFLKAVLKNLLPEDGVKI